jgi:hypothetical protein
MQAGGMGYGYQETPDIKRKRMMAQMLMQQAGQPLDANRTASGGLAIPISPFEGLAKVLQGGIAGYANTQADKAEKAARDDYQKTLGDALMAQQSGVKEWVNPDTGQVAIQGKPAGNQTMIDILRGNESTMPLAMNMQLSQAEAQQKLANDIAKEERTRKLDLQYAPQIEAAKSDATLPARMQVAAAGRPQTTVNLSTAEQFNRKFGGELGSNAAKGMAELSNQVRLDVAEAPRLQSALSLAQDPKTYQGFGAEEVLTARKMAKQLGIGDADKIPQAELFNALSQKGSNALLLLAKGTQTEGDAQRVQKIVFGLNKDPKTNVALIQNAINEANQRRQQLDAMTSSYTNALTNNDPTKLLDYYNAPARNVAPPKDATVSEGAVARNPTTGETVIMRNGQWVRQ